MIEQLKDEESMADKVKELIDFNNQLETFIGTLQTLIQDQQTLLAQQIADREEFEDALASTLGKLHIKDNNSYLKHGRNRTI